jgi:hypothetical protein
MYKAIRKMKLFLSVAIIAIATCLQSQSFIESNFPTKDGQIHYSEVVEVDTLSASELYLNAKNWLVESFKWSKSVIDLDDKEAKILVIKGHIAEKHNSLVQDPQNGFTLRIETKDGRYRYSLYDIRYKFYVAVMGNTTFADEDFEDWLNGNEKGLGTRKATAARQAWTDFCDELNKGFLEVIQSLKTGMKAVPTDW